MGPSTIESVKQHQHQASSVRQHQQQLPTIYENQQYNVVDRNTTFVMAMDNNTFEHDKDMRSKFIRQKLPSSRSLVAVPRRATNTNTIDANAALSNIQYLTDGGNNRIQTALMGSQPVVIKQLKPEVQRVVKAMKEIEKELEIHSRLEHKNIVSQNGAGHDSKGHRFIVLERLGGGTLKQLRTRIQDSGRKRKFFGVDTKRNNLPYVKVLEYAQQIAFAMDYLHRSAIDGSMVLHRDLKPDNIGE